MCLTVVLEIGEKWFVQFSSTTQDSRRGACRMTSIHSIHLSNIIRDSFRDVRLFHATSMLGGDVPQKPRKRVEVNKAIRPCETESHSKYFENTES